MSDKRPDTLEEVLEQLKRLEELSGRIENLESDIVELRSRLDGIEYSE